MKTDVHTHSAFSADGISPLPDMIARAAELKLAYYGVSDHFDYDYREQGILACGKPIRYIDEEAYFACARTLQREYENRLRVLVGGEFGFSSLKKCCEEYARVIEKYRPDFVVNSVHTCDGADCYFAEYFRGKTKEYAYRKYLDAVRESLEAPYRYDIVAHIGYCSRNATYPDKKLRYGDFAGVLDDILRTVIAKRKILEVNSSARGAGSEFLPDSDILTRYFELGGRLVSFGSDAHDASRVADKRELVTDALKKIGFTHVIVPDCGKQIAIEL